MRKEVKRLYESYGVDISKALNTLKNTPISLHCWQLDDVNGFENSGDLSGGIQTTGNYPGKARNFEELTRDLDVALSLIPGKKKLNLHACYAIFENGEYVNRDAIEPKHFAKWVEFAKERNMGIDFNPTFFSHDKVKDGLTLSSPDEETRKFWIEHGKACIRISQYFAEETGIPCVMNIWIPDGFKDIPADRYAPRQRMAESLDTIFAEKIDEKFELDAVESKLFGFAYDA